MPSFFSRLKGKDGPGKVAKKKGEQDAANRGPPAKPQWEDAYTRPLVEPEEVQALIHGCTMELKSRALDMPFLLLPFRPTSDPSAGRTFIRNYFDRGLHGEVLAQELRLTEPMVLCSVIKWCWSRISGGVVSWEAYELFKVGETDSQLARDAFRTFIPISVESETRSQIIFDFFDLLAAIAAHGKTNGLGGRKLSRMAGWWAFEHSDRSDGFEGGYRNWTTAADASCHLFFAYLRSLSPDSNQGINGINTLPMSLQKLVQETEYPPERSDLLQTTTTKVVMIVDSVSPTPFALLRRANHFQYRDDDRALQEFSNYEDPVKVLTDECRRVLKSISSVNQSQVSTSKDSTGLREASWSRFEDIGFSGGFDEADDEDEDSNFAAKKNPVQGLRTTPGARNNGLGRPTTPSWADFLSSGFVDETSNGPAPLLLPPDKILPPIDTRGRSSQSHHAGRTADKDLEPGELASITRFDLDDAFWWVWISSLAGEETLERKATFGRCALVETVIRDGKWLVMEEMVKGAAAAPEEGAYIAEKKSFWGRSRKTKSARRKSVSKQVQNPNKPLQSGYQNNGVSKTSIGPDQHAKIQAAALELQQRQRQQEVDQQAGRRGRTDVDMASVKTSSVFTLQPVIVNEASPAMKWAHKYDKDAIREAYLANRAAGTGIGIGEMTMQSNGHPDTDTARPTPPAKDQFLSPTQTSRAPSPAAPSPKAAPLPPTPGLHDPDEQHIELSEKAAEVPLPTEPHPIERKPVASTPASPGPVAIISVAPPAEPSTKDGRMSVDDAQEPIESSPSPESKRGNKLKKREGPSSGGGGGIRKLFGRKNRQSAVPEGAGEEIKKKLAPAPISLGRRLSNIHKKNPHTASPVSEVSEQRTVTSPVSTMHDDADLTPIATRPEPERLYEPSIRDSLSRVDTQEQMEANQAFSNFDQGPMEHIPVFAPGASPRASEDEAVATPPVIAVESTGRQPSLTIEGEPLAKSESQVHDRWARIRKDAADRAAAQRPSDQQSHGGYSQKTDGDDETSGEETIESRVARIKARVAELTGTMDGPTAPAPMTRR